MWCRAEPVLDLPLAVGRRELRNRLVLTTHGPRLAPADHLAYLDARSKDVALVGLHAMAGVADLPFGPADRGAGEGPPHPLTADGRRYLEETAVPAMAEQAEIVHRNGALAVGQILHLGAGQQADDGNAAVGASSIRDEYRRRLPRALGLHELADLADAVEAAAVRATRAGLDGIELHAAHGYLLQQFLSPRTNRRRDGYGGSPAARRRLLVELVERVRRALPDEAILGVRLPAGEAGEGGLTQVDVAVTAEAVASSGADYVSLSAGTYAGLGPGGLAYVASADVVEPPALGAAAFVRSRVSVPVIVSGAIRTAERAARVLRAGQADAVGLTRALIADPGFARLALSGAGAGAQARPCVGANECHRETAVRCAVNPVAGRERELRPPRSRGRRSQVLVIGAGPAGCEAARWAADAGHEVILADAADRIGGAVGTLAALPDPLVHRFAHYLGWVEKELARRRIDVRLGRAWDPGDVMELAADHVIVAVGAVTHRLRTAGGAPPAVVDALSFLAAPPPRARVVVVGGPDGHLAPALVARHATRGGAQVEILTEPLVPGADLDGATRVAVLRDLRRSGVVLRAGVEALGVSRDGLITSDLLTGDQELDAEVEVVVLAGDRRPRRGLGERLTDRGVLHTRIGDCRSPRRLLHACLDGARAGSADLPLVRRR